jgi:uncharacterized protein (DUF305 family)
LSAKAQNDTLIAKSSVKGKTMALLQTHTAVTALFVAAAMAFGLALPSYAEHVKPMTMDMSHDTSPSTPAYQGAMDTMMTDMMIPYSGNADVDFIKGMIPHHQGAVDNARIVLQYGKDPEVLKFAQAVIDAQEAEITWMTEWLAKNGG